MSNSELHSFKASSWNCASPRFSVAQYGSAYVMVSCSLLIMLFSSGGSYCICKMTKGSASDTERFCDCVVLIINCLSLIFCDSGRPGRHQLFYKQEAGHT